MTARRRREAAVVVVAGVMMLAGCSEPAEPSTLPVSEVVWPYGEPAGQLSTSKEAAAIREAQTQLNSAFAYADFSDPRLIEAVGYDAAVGWAQWMKDERFAEGPAPKAKSAMINASIWVSYFEPTSVERNSDTGAVTVYGCSNGYYADPTDFYYQTWELTQQDDGAFYADLLHSDATGSHGCEDLTIPAAKRETPIDLNDVGRSSVKMPLPREYYSDLGEISE